MNPRYGVRTVFIVLLLSGVESARAQDLNPTTSDTSATRGEEHQASAQENTELQAPGWLEKRLNRLETKESNGRDASTGFLGFRPLLGGLRQGAGLAGGLRFEPLASGGSTLLTIEAAASLRKYWGVRALAGYRGDPLVVAAYGQYRHMPQEHFFGIGRDSRLENESTYRLNEADVGVLAGFQASSRLAIGVLGGYVSASPGPGKDDDHPITQETFERLPALGVTTEHLAGGAWIQFDSRDPAPRRPFFQDLSPLEPGIVRMPVAGRRGLYVLVEFTNNVSLADQRFGFQRLNVQSQQYIPLPEGRHGFALREFASFTRTDGDDVPFHMLPAIGGAYTLRGYKLFRYRDRHAILLNAEYRRSIWRFADIVLFVDAGQVFAAASDVGINEMNTSYGGGVRLLARERGFLRAEVGRSTEGTQIIVLLTSNF